MNIVLPWNIFDSVIRLRRVSTFFSLFISRGLNFRICVWVSWKLRPRINKKRFKHVSILSSKIKSLRLWLLLKCFMVTQCSYAATARKDRNICPSGLSLSRTVDTKTEQHHSHSVFNFYFFGKKFTGKCPQTYSNLISTPLDECGSCWASTLRATRPWRHNLCELPLVCCKTIDPFSTTSSESRSGILPYNRNVILQTLESFSAFTRLYNAAASPVSRLRSAGPLTMISLVFFYFSKVIFSGFLLLINQSSLFFSFCQVFFFTFVWL